MAFVSEASLLVAAAQALADVGLADKFRHSIASPQQPATRRESPRWKATTLSGARFPSGSAHRAPATCMAMCQEKTRYTRLQAAKLLAFGGVMKGPDVAMWGAGTRRWGRSSTLGRLSRASSSPSMERRPARGRCGLDGRDYCRRGLGRRPPRPLRTPPRPCALPTSRRHPPLSRRTRAPPPWPRRTKASPTPRLEL